MEYFPSGEIFVENHMNDGLNSQYKFNGKEQDAETGYYYYGARYYNPRVSLWLNVDPLAEALPGRSPYEYTLSNPLRFTDPTGMYPDGGPGDPKASRSLPASETPNTVYLYNMNLGNSAQPFQDYYNSLSQGDIHSMRMSIYESSLGAYDTGVARAMYGLDNNGDINVPQSIKENLWSASGHQVFNKIKDNFATQYSGVDPSSLNGIFNPIANAQWMSARALAVTSNSEAKGMIAQTAMQTAPAYLGGHLNLKPNVGIFGANEGWGWFGQKGLNVGGYKIEAMYLNPTTNGGTYFSVKQMKTGGALWRLDYGPMHSTGNMSIHGTYRFHFNGTQFGGAKTQIPLYQWK